MLPLPQTTAATWRVLCARVGVVFPWFLVLSLLYSFLCTSSGGVLYWYFYFYSACFFQVSASSACGGTRQFFHTWYLVPVCFIISVFFSFDLSSLFFVFKRSLFALLYFIECKCRACRISVDDDMPLHCPLS